MVVNSYLEFLKRVDEGFREILVTPEFFDWMNDNLDVLLARNGDYYYGGVKIVIKEGEE